MSYETTTETPEIDTETRTALEKQAIQRTRSAIPSVVWAVLWVATAVYATTGIVAPVLILAVAVVYRYRTGTGA
ncbi:hypothetical protein [Natrialba swarupiae]|uniref:Uncharacterized protein n=1 Tax=Natrialba swarupiae TaxID=2448032 RepID=A0A5D5AIX3_9EURY|nr:hypothetical protein [Natrialba swarupiae]TYT61808.1 hypothetical protein FYC77_11220 [Natrialba swarupiae]